MFTVRVLTVFSLLSIVLPVFANKLVHNGLRGAA